MSWIIIFITKAYLCSFTVGLGFFSSDYYLLSTADNPAYVLSFSVETWFEPQDKT